MQWKIDINIDKDRKQNAAKPIIKNQGHLIELIKNRPMDESIRNIVIKEVCQFPDATLDFVWINLDNIIDNCVLRMHKGEEENDI